MKRILVVEDDRMIASGLVYALEREGYAVSHGLTVNEAVNAIAAHKFDLAILDMQLPDGTGFDVRKKLSDTAVIFLTVVDDEACIVKAFEGGADDYVIKPFRIRELLARVKRTLNEAAGNSIPSLLTVGDITIDVSAGKTYINGALLVLTALEYRLLLIFASHRGQLLTRAQILENIWDSAGSFVEDNTLTVYIKRLREKLGDSLNIETVRGIGYRVD
ncbi:MAG: response regulator transcription factor [Defluviitaleaceae bacterium]|nr:response regulator transcription factor [Defluviitaleaceae bacterium]MCL2835217.1 response regulator transcription factor [Defluviitaleaceae bacterium]